MSDASETQRRRLRFRTGAGGRGNPLLRLVDGTVAVALLALLGATRRRRPVPSGPERIGIMKSTGIGDMIVATAVVRDVIEAQPRAEVVLIAGRDNAGLARLVPGARVLELEPAKPWSAIPQIRAERLDAFLDLGQWTRLEAIYAAFSGAGWTAGFATPGQRRGRAYDEPVDHSSDVSELENFRAVTETIGAPGRNLPRFAVTTEQKPPVDRRYAVFHMWPGGYRSELREWPAERWRELATDVAGRGLAIVLTGGPGDAERTESFIRSGAGLDAEIISVAGRYRIEEMVGVLAGAACVISVNTGVMHLAAAVGAPTIALNGPTSARRWGAIGPNVVNVDSDLPGCGYLNLGFEYEGRRIDCMLGIGVERVAAAVDHVTDD